MKQIRKKLSSRAGESIAEALIAVLVIAVALTMLASMISATTNMVKTSEKKMDEYYTASAALENLDSDKTVKISFSSTSLGSIDSVTAIYEENRVLPEPVIAYRLRTN